MGLGSRYWHDVISVLKDIIPVYDKVNLAISLGKAKELREKGIKFLLDKPFVLDAGSGHGNMSEMLLKKSNVEIVMLDPIPEMLMIAKERSDIPKISGVFEHLPFNDQTFNGIMCGYSFRDAISYTRAIDEFARVLKDDGRLVIVDLGKPDNQFYRSGVSFYLRFTMPIIAFIVAGRLGLKFKEIYGTWQRLPTNNNMIKLLKARFKNVEIYEMLFGGAVVFVAYK